MSGNRGWAAAWGVVLIAGAAAAAGGLGCAVASARPNPGATAAVANAVAPALAVPVPVATSSPSTAGRFFVAGDGRLAIKNHHTGEAVDVRFRGADGVYDRAAIDRLAGVFRSRGASTAAPLSLRLIETLDFLEDQTRPSEILLVSGYRSPEYNSAIRKRGAQAAKASMHTEGLAADVKLGGVDLREVWLRTRELECCGAGYYASSGFIHLDVGRPRFWEESTSRVSENLAAGNARVFARTEFDRYHDLTGAEIRLHSVTLLPLHVQREAVLEAGDGRRLARVRLEPAGRGFDAESRGDACMALAADPDPGGYRLRVAAVAALPTPSVGVGGSAQRARVVLTTCPPRLEATPERIETGPLELGTP